MKKLIAFSVFLLLCSTAFAANKYDPILGEYRQKDAGGGDVFGPATNSDGYIPLWDGVDSKTLKNGIKSGTMTDGRWCSYSTVGGFQCSENAPAGAGDMVLASVQSVTGLKTFDKDKIAMLGTSTGKTVISTANTSATDYTVTLPAETGTVCTTGSVCSGYQASGALLATGATTGATSQAQAFTDGVKTGIIFPSADSTTAVQINKANGTTNVLNVDTTNGRVGIGTSPTNILTVAPADGGGISLGDRNTAETYYIGRTGGGFLSGNTTSIGFSGDGATHGNIIYNSNGGYHLFTGTDSGGKVGIGTTSPATALDVTGTVTATTFNGLSLSPTANGFTIAGGTTSKTLTVPLDASVSGTNTGDQDLSGLVTKATYDAQTILQATSDNTPVALTVGEQTVVGRATGGNIAALAIDSDLSSVSANDDTVPSAKAVKAVTDGKLALAGGTMTGDITLGAAKQIVLTVPTGDVTCTGNSTAAFNSGYTSSAVGDLVYLDSSATWQLADADAIATSGGMLGIALEVKTSGNALRVALPGSFVRVNAWNWTTVGETLYVSETAGGIATAIPTGADGVVRVIGWATNADYIYFYPSPGNSTVIA